VPLLELQEMQHSAMFSRDINVALLTMCSQEGRWPRLQLSENATPQ
jgi:hypothetical protein